MSEPALVYATSTLVVETCCSCGAKFALEDGMRINLKRTHNTFYCPAGHGQHYTGKSEAERLRERLTNAEARLTSTRDQLDATERSRRALKGQITKMRRRIGEGTCPFCTASFPNVAAHMADQHPEEVADHP